MPPDGRSPAPRRCSSWRGRRGSRWRSGGRRPRRRASTSRRPGARSPDRVGFPAVARCLQAEVHGVGEARMAATTIDLRVRGMSCASCVVKIEAALTAQPGVERATVNLATERVTIRYDGRATPRALVGTIRDLGYEVPVATATIPVRGIIRSGQALETAHKLRIMIFDKSGTLKAA